VVTTHLEDEIFSQPASEFPGTRTYDHVVFISVILA